ncbi:MAG: hypothetical protein PHD76_14920 [Methylacidiphilales bacterium]|nr:hypothetical protein [Candidatus Methylacidiphilales bacterium]
MKSAYELAMERLEKSQPAAKLSDAQRAGLAEITNRYESKIAERKTFLESKIREAEFAGDLKESGELSEQLRRDLSVLNEEMEAKKEAVRKT